MKWLFVLLSIVRVVSAANPNPSEIIEFGESRLRGKTSQIQMNMQITHAAYSRALSLRSWTSGKAQSVVSIVKPAKEEGIVSIRLENQMWNFFPKTEQTVRVPTSVMLQSWMGSDFTNDDLMKLSSLTTDYTHRWLKEEVREGQKLHLIECLPRKDAPVVWGKILYWARVSDKLPVKEEYYDDRGKLVRTLTLAQFKKMDDRVIPTEYVIRNAAYPEEFTRISYEKIIFDRQIPESHFDKSEIRELSQQSKNPLNLWFDKALIAFK